MRTAVLILVVVSGVRWVWSMPGGSRERATGSVLETLVEETDEAVSEAERRSRPFGENEKIDPNRADEVELDRLPGVGPATARAVVDARLGGAVFRRPEDLEAVRGIGPAAVAKIERYLDFSSPPLTTPRRPAAAQSVDVNRAGSDELQSLPGVGPSLAARIIERRRVRPFRTLDELLDVRGIGPATLERLRTHARVGPSR